VLRSHRRDPVRAMHDLGDRIREFRSVALRQVRDVAIAANVTARMIGLVENSGEVPPISAEEMDEIMVATTLLMDLLLDLGLEVAAAEGAPEVTCAAAAAPAAPAIVPPAAQPPSVPPGWHSIFATDHIPSSLPPRFAAFHVPVAEGEASPGTQPVMPRAPPSAAPLVVISGGHVDHVTINNTHVPDPVMPPLPSDDVDEVMPPSASGRCWHVGDGRFGFVGRVSGAGGGPEHAPVYPVAAYLVRPARDRPQA
jgi:hypothetical protein